MTEPLTGLSPDDQEDERLRAELEQARVALEDMDQRLVQLNRIAEDLRRQLAEETRRRESVDARLQALAAAAARTRPDESQEVLLREQLSTALEELHVMAEELSLAQDALRDAAAME